MFRRSGGENLFILYTRFEYRYLNLWLCHTEFCFKRFLPNYVFFRDRMNIPWQANPTEISTKTHQCFHMYLFIYTCTTEIPRWDCKFLHLNFSISPNAVGFSMFNTFFWDLNDHKFGDINEVLHLEIPEKSNLHDIVV